jgi:hypothetical protein
MSNYLKQLLFSLLSIITLMFWSCKPSPIPAYTGNTMLRIVNVTPEDNSINFYINDTIKNRTAITYKQTLNNITTSAGEKSVYVKNNGVLIEKSRLNILFLNQFNYTVFLSGKIAKDSLNYITLVDSLKNPSNGKAKVRIINTISNIGSIEGVFTTALKDSVANFSNINYATSTNYLEFVPGNYLVKIRKSNDKETLAALANIQILAGKIYTIYGSGLLNGGPNYPLSVNLLIDK